MNRPEKATEIDSLSGRFQEAKNAFLIGFSGLNVEQVTNLRRKIRETSSSYRVVKNRLAKRAAAGTPLEALVDGFEGPTGVAYNDHDPVVLAKVLSDFAKENPSLAVRVGLIEAKDVLDTDRIKALASLPGLPELRAQVLSLIQAPAGKLVRLLNTPGSQMVQVIEARRKSLAEDIA